MSDSVEISGPVATIVDAGARVVESIMAYSSAVRSTESQQTRDEEDHIRFQAYWDWRALLEFCGIVGAPMTWPPAAKDQPK